MARSRVSGPGTASASAGSTLRTRMAEQRNRGHSGSAIPLHRALLTLRVPPHDVAAALVLALLLTVGWALSLDLVGAAWRRLLEAGQGMLGLEGEVAVTLYPIGPWFELEIPYLVLPAAAPDPQAWWIATLLALGLAALSRTLSRQWLPIAYALRGLAAVEAGALVWCAVCGRLFPYSLADYIADSLAASMVLLAAIPLLLGFTYYLFDFHWLKKLGLTALVLLHLSLFIPLRYLLQAYLLHRFSLLVLPLFATLFGLPLDALIVLAFYSWGMSWRERAGWSETRSAPRHGSTADAGQRPVAAGAG